MEKNTNKDVNDKKNKTKLGYGTSIVVSLLVFGIIVYFMLNNAF